MKGMDIPIFLHATYKKEIAEKYFYEFKIADSNITNFKKTEGKAAFKFEYFSKHFGEIPRKEIKQQLSWRTSLDGLIGAMAIKEADNITLDRDFINDQNEYGVVPYSVPVDKIKKQIKTYQTYTREYKYTINEPSHHPVLMDAILIDEESLTEGEYPSLDHVDFLQRYRFLITVTLEIDDSILKELHAKNLTPKVKELSLKWPYLDAVPYLDDRPLIESDNPHFNPEKSVIHWSDKPFWEVKQEDKHKSGNDSSDDKGSDSEGSDGDSNGNNNGAGNDSDEANINNDGDSEAEQGSEEVQGETQSADESKAQANDKDAAIAADETPEAEPNRELPFYVDIEHPSSLFNGLKTKGKLVIEVPNTLLSGCNWLFFNVLGKPDESEIKLTSTIEAEFEIDLSAVFKRKQYLHLWQMEIEGTLPEENRFLVIEQVLRDKGIRITRQPYRFEKDHSDNRHKGFRIEGEKFMGADVAYFILEIYGFEKVRVHLPSAVKKVQLDQEAFLKLDREDEKVQIDLYVRFLSDFQNISKFISEIHLLLKERLTRVVLT